MNDDQMYVELIEKTEAEVADAARKRLQGQLAYFNTIEEAAWKCLRNDGKAKAFANVDGNPKPFAFITLARSLSMARVAMDVTLRGHPLEGMGLSRTLLELAECTQYLVRHSELIDRFLRGKLKPDEVLKRAKLEQKTADGSNLAKLWRIVSPFAHASPSMLVLILTPEPGNRLVASLLVDRPKTIDDTAFGICAAFFMQYFTYRMVMADEFVPSADLRDLDDRLLESASLRNYAGWGTMNDQDIEEVRRIFASGTGDASSESSA
jgi:hypothetical protein